MKRGFWILMACATGLAMAERIPWLGVFAMNAGAIALQEVIFAIHKAAAEIVAELRRRKP